MRYTSVAYIFVQCGYMYFHGNWGATSVRALISYQGVLGSILAGCQMWAEYVVGSRPALRVCVLVLQFSALCKTNFQIPIRPGQGIPVTYANLFMLSFLFSNSIKVFYGSGDCLVLNIPTSDSDDIPEIVRRLEEISIGCQVKQIFLPGFLELSMLHACIHTTKCQSKFLKSKCSKAFTRTNISLVVN